MSRVYSDLYPKQALPPLWVQPKTEKKKHRQEQKKDAEKEKHLTIFFILTEVNLFWSKEDHTNNTEDEKSSSTRYILGLSHKPTTGFAAYLHTFNYCWFNHSIFQTNTVKFTSPHNSKKLTKNKNHIIHSTWRCLSIFSVVQSLWARPKNANPLFNRDPTARTRSFPLISKIIVATSTQNLMGTRQKHNRNFIFHTNKALSFTPCFFLRRILKLI